VGSDIYLIGYTTFPDTFDKTLPIADQMISSFKGIIYIFLIPNHVKLSKIAYLSTVVSRSKNSSNHAYYLNNVS
jgi:hypothetical protein